MSEPDSIVLVHSSDFHVKKDEADPLSRSNDIRKLFTVDAKQLMPSIGKPNALVFSGDIAFKGSPAEYDVAREFFTEVLSALEIKEQRVLVVPGNHDVDRTLAQTLEARMMRDRLRALPEPGADKEFLERREELLKPISAYQQFAMPYDGLINGELGYWEVSNAEDSLAKEYLTSDFPICIRGISTVHASDWNDDLLVSLDDPPDEGSHMYVARGQLACPPITEETPFRILVGHHPINWWRFSDERKALASSRFHLHLFGHEHEFMPQVEGNAVCVRAGAINPEGWDDHPRYNWIKITKRGREYFVRIWSRVLNPISQEFMEDPEWPGGQGYKVQHDLSRKPEMLEPEPERSDLPTLVSDETVVERETPEAEESVGSVESQTKVSARAIRFALFSQPHACYARVFKQLGLEPSHEQKSVLGGLEFYKEELDKLLSSGDIVQLLNTMREEGIDVD